jgi:catechol 2,3-dioxygenase-like lactoylglutathione lyase family enzyme
MTALPAERERLRKFYGEVLGCKVMTKSDSFDLVRLGPDFYIGVAYDPQALNDSDAQKAIWLEIRVDDPAGLKQKILAFGIKQLEFWDKEHFYFQAPGGQVFRLIGMTEDMSNWQQ